jgi:acetoin dehydrogenase, E1 component, alpha subunit
MLGFSKIGIWIRSPLSVIKNPPKTIVDVFIVAVCRFDQGAAVEGSGVGFLKKLVLNILFQMKERSSDVFQTTFDQI